MPMRSVADVSRCRLPTCRLPTTVSASVATNSMPSCTASFASNTFAGALCGGSSGNTVSQRAITPTRSRVVQGRMCNGWHLSSASSSPTRVCAPRRAVGNDWHRVLRGATSSPSARAAVAVPDRAVHTDGSRLGRHGTSCSLPLGRPGSGPLPRPLPASAGAYRCVLLLLSRSCRPGASGRRCSS